MEFKKHYMEGVVEFFPRVFNDSRGWFMESFSRKAIEEAGVEGSFVQDNLSLSAKNVLRGLHFQKPPFAQVKLVYVISGSSLDVIVDLRKGSPTYGQHLKVLLSAEKHNMLYVPAGFAHGFLSLEDNTIFAYKCSDYYNVQSEGGLCWKDSNLNIDWEIANPNVSDKDQALPAFKDFISPF
jgi:dTDP-4-dehydrorhamnose 3,5-epimerase